jgi:predicted DsbA family dithiol-disulfide isomerase
LSALWRVDPSWQRRCRVALFQLNPNMPANGVPRELHLSFRFGNARRAKEAHEVVSRAVRAEGIDFAFDRIRRTPNTLRADRLIRLAMLEGCAAKIVETLFQAYFLDGLDIGDVETLAAAAQCTGLDETVVRHYLASEAGTVEVRAEEHRARRLGIHAVPYFILDRGYAISGAQEPEMFLPLFDITAGPRDRPAAAEGWEHATTFPADPQNQAKNLRGT